MFVVTELTKKKHPIEMHLPPTDQLGLPASFHFVNEF